MLSSQSCLGPLHPGSVSAGAPSSSLWTPKLTHPTLQGAAGTAECNRRTETVAGLSGDMPSGQPCPSACLTELAPCSETLPEVTAEGPCPL